MARLQYIHATALVLALSVLAGSCASGAFNGALRQKRGTERLSQLFLDEQAAVFPSLLSGLQGRDSRGRRRKRRCQSGACRCLARLKRHRGRGLLMVYEKARLNGLEVWK